VKVKFAEAPPVDCGANVAVKEMLFPAAIVTGKERPEREYSLLFTLAADTVTLAPEAVNLPVRFALDPTVTWPKFKAPGVTLKLPVAPAEPERGIVRLGRLDATDTLPVTVFELVGVKVTFKVTLCPGANVIGMPGAVTLNWLPVTLSDDSVTPEPPVLLSVSGSV
jgi:hypothetical protein